MAINTPSISLSQVLPWYGVSINITNPTDPVDDADHNHVYRRVVGETEWLELTTTSLNSTYVSYEAATGIDYEYQAVAMNEVMDESGDSNIESFTVTFNEWFIKNLDGITQSINPFVDGNTELTINSREEQSVFYPLGRRTPLVITDEQVKADRFELTFQFLNDEEWIKFKALRAQQKTLLLQSPMVGEQWYFVFGAEGRQRVVNTVNAYRLFSIEIIEVDRPANA